VLKDSEQVTLKRCLNLLKENKQKEELYRNYKGWMMNYKFDFIPNL
jgi:hypothetical protein